MVVITAIKMTMVTGTITVMDVTNVIKNTVEFTNVTGATITAGTISVMDFATITGTTNCIKTGSMVSAKEGMLKPEDTKESTEETPTGGIAGVTKHRLKIDLSDVRKRGAAAAQNPLLTSHLFLEKVLQNEISHPLALTPTILPAA